MFNHTDSKEEIEFCLRCPRDECTNCLQGGAQNPTTRHSDFKIDGQKFVDMYNKRYTIKRMAYYLQVPYDVCFNKIKYSLKLEVNPEKREVISTNVLKNASKRVREAFYFKEDN